MKELTQQDLKLCVSRIPKDIRELMNKYPLFVAGGFIRSTISGEKVNDVDLFGGDKQTLEFAANLLRFTRNGRLHTTDNAFTVLTSSRMPAQFISRWLYSNAEDLCNDFDFTVCQAVIGWSADRGWYSVCSENFYADLAAKRLVYTFPQREEAAGGSIMRVRKFLKRGYNIQAWSFAGVIARLVWKVGPSALADSSEQGLAKVLTGLLREVDPLIVVDGLDMVDEHELISLEEEKNG